MNRAKASICVTGRPRDDKALLDGEHVEVEVAHDGSTLFVEGERALVRALLLRALDQLEKLARREDVLRELAEPRQASSPFRAICEPTSDAYVLVPLERAELYTEAQAEDFARVASHQGVRVALVAARNVYLYDPR